MTDGDTEAIAADRAAPPGTITHILWSKVTGAQLEELLFGLLDAMGASHLVWRAGTNCGVNAADGGRDIEATFSHPTPDGASRQEVWWIESKGRKEAVEKQAVQNAVMDASAGADVVVIATNSRFTNPTRDWVRDHVQRHPAPAVSLWDRDHLDRLVRAHPTVAARVLPEALSNLDRLTLLISRFEDLGEEPTTVDLDYFWERREWLSMQEPMLLARAIAMFLYREGTALPRLRAWWRLISESAAPHALLIGLIQLPDQASDLDAPRPLEQVRTLAAASRLLLASLRLLPDDDAYDMTLNPWKYTNHADIQEEDLEAWRHGALAPALAFSQAELLGPCADDCNRVMADKVHESEPLATPKWWNLVFGRDERIDERQLVFEDFDASCVVGADVASGCPLVVSNQLGLSTIVRGLQAVIRFRESHPDGARDDSALHHWGPATRITALSDHGLAYQTQMVSDMGRGANARKASEEANPGDPEVAP